MKVEDDVDEKDEVDHAVEYKERHIVIFYLEGGVVRNHDGGVEGEDQDDPVPHGLEEAVVQNDVRGSFGGFQSVLGKHIRVYVHHLVTRKWRLGRVMHAEMKNISLEDFWEHLKE